MVNGSTGCEYRPIPDPAGKVWIVARHRARPTPQERRCSHQHQQQIPDAIGRHVADERHGGRSLHEPEELDAPVHQHDADDAVEVHRSESEQPRLAVLSGEGNPLKRFPRKTASEQRRTTPRRPHLGRDAEHRAALRLNASARTSARLRKAAFNAYQLRPNFRFTCHACAPPSTISPHLLPFPTTTSPFLEAFRGHVFA
jgi:hypothetical protein